MGTARGWAKALERARELVSEAEGYAFEASCYLPGERQYRARVVADALEREASTLLDGMPVRSHRTKKDGKR